MKKILFTAFQPAAIVLILMFWGLAPATLTNQSWVLTLASIGTLVMVQILEFLNERHAGWRLDRREFLTDTFYTVLYFTVIANLATALVDNPLASLKESLGITTAWAMHLPFVAQVALAFFLNELGQYWMHRLMHNTFLWWTHAPHHHITQLNAAKGLVGNPVEVFLVSLSVIALFDLPLNAVFCSFNLIGAVSAFAHGNVRFDPPRWYAYIFTTVEAHSKHHSVGIEETRCNYANSLILCDHMFGTFHEGESEVVGQDQRRRLPISEQFMFPFKPLIAMFRTSVDKSASISG
jgi:sterol desaturase/sphingolipid hydroxylase (fatty acid hydroxylase superfamily)